MKELAIGFDEPHSCIVTGHLMAPVSGNHSLEFHLSHSIQHGLLLTGTCHFLDLEGLERGRILEKERKRYSRESI